MIFLFFILWYLVGLGFTYISVKISWGINNQLTSDDIIGLGFFALFGPICIVVLIIEIIANYKIIKEEIFYQRFKNKKQLALKQLRLKKLKKLNRFRFIKIW
jgi:hypothetical protein